MKKRVLSALMVLCMVLTLLPVSAFAADTKDLRDTEFHIMGFSDLKELVAEHKPAIPSAESREGGAAGQSRSCGR